MRPPWLAQCLPDLPDLTKCQLCLMGHWACGAESSPIWPSQMPLDMARARARARGNKQWDGGRGGLCDLAKASPQNSHDYHRGVGHCQELKGLRQQRGGNELGRSRLLLSMRSCSSPRRVWFMDFPQKHCGKKGSWQSSLMVLNTNYILMTPTFIFAAQTSFLDFSLIYPNTHSTS